MLPRLTTWCILIMNKRTLVFLSLIIAPSCLFAGSTRNIGFVHSAAEYYNKCFLVRSGMSAKELYKSNPEMWKVATLSYTTNGEPVVVIKADKDGVTYCFSCAKEGITL